MRRFVPVVARAPEGVSKKEVTQRAVSNLDRLLQGQRETAHLRSEPAGTHPMPAIQNSPATLCGAPVAQEHPLRSLALMPGSRVREVARADDEDPCVGANHSYSGFGH